jgi:hypothetical protein
VDSQAAATAYTGDSQASNVYATQSAAAVTQVSTTVSMDDSAVTVNSSNQIDATTTYTTDSASQADVTTAAYAYSPASQADVTTSAISEAATTAPTYGDNSTSATADAVSSSFSCLLATDFGG